MKKALLLSLSVIMSLGLILISCNLPSPTPVEKTKPTEQIFGQKAFVVAASDSLNKERADYVSDGTDDQKEIQAAIDAASAVNGSVTLLEGTYSISGIISVKANVLLTGSGKVVLDGTGLGDFVLGPWRDSTIENITIAGGNYGGINIVNPHIRVINTRFLNIKDPVNGEADAIHVSGANAYDVLIDGVYIYNTDRGIEVEDGAHDVIAQNGYLNGVPATGSSPLYSIGAHGHKEKGRGYAHHITYRNFKIENSAGFNAYDGSDNVTFDGISIFSPTSVVQIAHSTHTIMNSYIVLDTSNNSYARLIVGGGVVQNTTVKGLGGETAPIVNGSAKLTQSKFIGSGHYGLQVSNGDVTIDSSDFSPNPDSPSNYGLRVDGGTVNVTGNMFHGNFATPYSVYQTGGKVNFVDNTVRDRGLRMVGNSRVTDNTLQFRLEYAFDNEVKYADNHLLYEVNVGEEFAFGLESNSLTGQWQLAKPLDKNTLELVGSKFITKETKPSEVWGFRNVGIPFLKPLSPATEGGREIWAFKAVGRGITEISLRYISTGKKDAPPQIEQTFIITVK